MDKLRAMTGFVRIVDKGSLTAAAADLGVSLPAMVRSPAALERELGATLLNRTTRRLHLTDEGRQYLEHCRAILGHVHEAEATLHSRRAAPRGRLAVTASTLFGRRYVGPIMAEFVRRHPGVSPDLLFVDRVVNLVEEGLGARGDCGRPRAARGVCEPRLPARARHAAPTTGSARAPLRAIHRACAARRMGLSLEAEQGRVH